MISTQIKKDHSIKLKKCQNQHKETKKEHLGNSPNSLKRDSDGEGAGLGPLSPFSSMLISQFSRWVPFLTWHRKEQDNRHTVQGELVNTVFPRVQRSRTLLPAVPGFLLTCFNSPHFPGPSLKSISKHSRFVPSYEQQSTYGKFTTERCKDSQVVSIKRHRFVHISLQKPMIY